MSEFKRIENIADYVKTNVENGEMMPMEFAKTARISAVQGVEGQKIATIMANGLKETENTVTLDEKTGQPGWIVTNPGGEQYIVPDSTFQKKYEIDPQNPNLFKPKGAPVNCVALSENVVFEAPWGGDMNIAAGGVLVLAGEKDIYGIQADEFAQTYGPTDKGARESLSEVLAMLGSDKTPEQVMETALKGKMETELDDLDAELEALGDKNTNNKNENSTKENITNDENDDHDVL